MTENPSRRIHFVLVIEDFPLGDFRGTYFSSLTGQKPMHLFRSVVSFGL